MSDDARRIEMNAEYHRLLAQQLQSAVAVRADLEDATKTCEIILGILEEIDRADRPIKPWELENIRLELGGLLERLGKR